MALEGRKGTRNKYLYRKERRGRKVVSIYLGRAPETIKPGVCATPEPVCATPQVVDTASDSFVPDEERWAKFLRPVQPARRYRW
jgi:hypothetical protein